jgi:serine/threonine protein kinase
MNEEQKQIWRPRSDEEDGDFILIKKIGSGGMGEVWLGRQVSLDRQVALKFLLNTEHQEELETRLETEAKSAARLNHPNITQVIAFIRFKNCPALVLEYIEGRSLKDKIRSGAYFSLKDIFSIAEQVTRGLSAAEKFEVVHRDIKPANLMISDDGHLKICDFGLARIGEKPNITQKGAVMGTAHYMSPEQAAGKPADKRSDFYSLGVLLFEMLEGHLPYQQASPMAIMQAHIEEPIPRMSNKDVPEAMEGFVRRLLDKRPQNRPSDCDVLKNNIEITRLACVHSNMDNSIFHSRRVEMRLISEASQTLSRPRHRVWPLVKTLSTIALSVLLCLSIYWLSTVKNGRQLPLPHFPENTHLILSLSQGEENLASPLPEQLEINPAALSLTIESEFYISKKFNLRKGLPQKSELVLEPDDDLIFKRMMTLLKDNSMKDVNWKFLDKIYNTPPDRIKFLRKEINRLRHAKKLISKKNITAAVRVLESLKDNQTKMVTRNFLKKARIKLIPDKKIQNKLAHLQKLIRRGECDKARNLITYINYQHEQLAVDSYDVFQREIDAIIRYQKKISLFQDSQNLDMELIKSTMEQWGQLAPEDPQYLTFKKRYELESSRLYLHKKTIELRKDLESKQRSWNPWSFQQHLRKLNKSKTHQSMLLPYIQSTEKKMAQSFCKRLETFFNHAQIETENNKHKYFENTKYLTQQLKAVKDLQKIGWKNLHIQLKLQSQVWNKGQLEVRCQFKITGQWDNVSPPQICDDTSNITFYVKALLTDTVSISNTPTLSLNHSATISP